MRRITCRIYGHVAASMSCSFLDAAAQRVADGGWRRRLEPFDVFVRQEGKRETGGCACKYQSR